MPFLACVTNTERSKRSKEQQTFGLVFEWGYQNFGRNIRARRECISYNRRVKASH